MQGSGRARPSVAWIFCGLEGKNICLREIHEIIPVENWYGIGNLAYMYVYKMVVPPKRPKMIIFSRKTPWLLGTTILGNPHMDVVKIQNKPVYENE